MDVLGLVIVAGVAAGAAGSLLLFLFECLILLGSEPNGASAVRQTHPQHPAR